MTLQGKQGNNHLGEGVYNSFLGCKQQQQSKHSCVGFIWFPHFLVDHNPKHLTRLPASESLGRGDLPLDACWQGMTLWPFIHKLKSSFHTSWWRTPRVKTFRNCLQCLRDRQWNQKFWLATLMLPIGKHGLGLACWFGMLLTVLHLWMIVWMGLGAFFWQWKIELFFCFFWKTFILPGNMFENQFIQPAFWTAFGFLGQHTA